MHVSSYSDEWIDGQKWTFCIATFSAAEHRMLKSDEKSHLFTVSYSVDGFTYTHGDLTAYAVIMNGDTVFNVPLNRDTVVLRAPDAGFIAQLREKDRGTK